LTDKASADADIKAVESVLSDMSDPAQTKPQPAKRRPVQLAKQLTDIRLPGDGASGALVPDETVPQAVTAPKEKASAKPVELPNVTASTSGLPNVELVPQVLAARANLKRLSEQRAAVAGEVSSLEKELGLKVGSSAGEIEKLAVQLLAAGKSDEGIQKLETLRVKLGRLVKAEAQVVNECNAAVDVAKRELTPRAVAVGFTPAAKRVAKAFLELIAAQDEEWQASGNLRAAGFPPPPPTLPPGGFFDPVANPLILQFVRAGLVTSGEVLAVCQRIAGL